MHNAPANTMNLSTAVSPGFEPTVSWSDLAAHRRYLVQFAQRRLRDSTLAEDAVHDVFEAVISGRASFAGRSALRSWLTAILKHKMVDLLRTRTGQVSLEGDGDGSGEALEVECPGPRPDQLAEQRELLSRTLRRIDGLPPSLRQAMQMRVLQDRSSSEVCRALAISEDNLFVRLHRARRQLLS